MRAIYIPVYTRADAELRIKALELAGVHQLTFADLENMDEEQVMQGYLDSRLLRLLFPLPEG